MTVFGDQGAKLRSEAEKAAKVAALLERLESSGAFEGLTVKLAYGGTKTDDLCVTVSTDTRENGAAIAEGFISRGFALPCAFSRNTFATFKPLAHMSANERENIVYPADDLWPVAYQADPHDGGPRSRFGAGVLRMWLAIPAEPEPVTVALRIEMSADPCGVTVERFRERVGGRVETVTHYSWNDLPEGERVSYSSGVAGEPGQQMVMFWREPGASPTPSHYLAQNVASRTRSA